MELSHIRIQNYKSIRDADVESIGDLSVLVGKNDTGKSSFLEAVRMFLSEKAKPEPEQFHMGRENDITITATFEQVPNGLRQALEDDIETNGTFRITRRWQFPESTRSMADTYLGRNEVQLSAESLTGEYQDLNKSDTRAALWEYLPEPVYVPAERNVSEETTFKSGTLLDELLDPLLEDSEVLNQARSELKEELGQAIDDIETDLSDRLTEHVDSINQVEIDVGDISLSNAFSPEVRVTDKHSEMSIPIGQRGSGVGSMLVLSLVESFQERHLGDGYLMLFEEPGNWLHPEAERRMRAALKQIAATDAQVMLSTHSPVFIDRPGNGDVFVVRRMEGQSSIEKIEGAYLSAVEELGVRNSDALQSDFVVYVEGPSDVQMLSTVADQYLDPDIRSRISIQFLGGSNVRDCELDKLAKINRNFGFLLDSDRTGADDDLKPYVKELQTRAEQSKHDVVFRVLKRREIENYFSPEGINSKLGLDVSDGFVGPYDDIPDKINAEIQRHHAKREVQSHEERTCDKCGHTASVGDDYDKSQGAAIVRAMYESGQRVEPLEDYFDEVIAQMDK